MSATALTRTVSAGAPAAGASITPAMRQPTPTEAQHAAILDTAPDDLLLDRRRATELAEWLFGLHRVRPSLLDVDAARGRRRASMTPLRIPRRVKRERH